jgi:hypothetical protein
MMIKNFNEAANQPKTLIQGRFADNPGVPLGRADSDAIAHFQGPVESGA